MYFSDCIKKQLRAKADTGCACGFGGRCGAGGVCVCTNSSQVTSTVPGASCGPVRGNATIAYVMVKQPAHCWSQLFCLLSKGQITAGKPQDTVSIGHIVPTVRAGSEMWSETNDLMFSSLLDNACRIALESGTFCDKHVSVIFLRSFGYSFLIGK